MNGKYQIKQVTILYKDMDEIMNYYPNETFSGTLSDHRNNIIDLKYPEIKESFPDIKKNDLVVHLTHKKIE